MQSKITKADESRLLDAAKNGDLDIIKEYAGNHPPSALTSIIDSTGCTLLHWSAGSNQEATLRYLLTIFHPDTQVKSKQAIGRTALQ